MKIEIVYNGDTAKCRLTEVKGHPEVLVDFNSADEFSQIYALSAFDCIKQYWHWNRQRKIKKEEL